MQDKSNCPICKNPFTNIFVPIKQKDVLHRLCNKYPSHYVSLFVNMDNDLVFQVRYDNLINSTSLIINEQKEIICYNAPANSISIEWNPNLELKDLFDLDIKFIKIANFV